MNKIIKYFYLFILTAIIISILIVIGRSFKECDDRNGTFVRGLMWFECIEVKDE